MMTIAVKKDKVIFTGTQQFIRKTKVMKIVCLHSHVVT
jgi:hypothetical protein